MLRSDESTLSGQLHIVDSQYQSLQKTLIVCETNSRFTLFIPVSHRLRLSVLNVILQKEWQSVLIEILMSKLTDIEFDVTWVKNTAPSIDGHITDVRYWVSNTLREQDLRLTLHHTHC